MLFTKNRFWNKIYCFTLSPLIFCTLSPTQSILLFYIHSSQISNKSCFSLFFWNFPWHQYLQLPFPSSIILQFPFLSNILSTKQNLFIGLFINFFPRDSNYLSSNIDILSFHKLFKNYNFHADSDILSSCIIAMSFKLTICWSLLGYLNFWSSRRFTKYFFSRDPRSDSLYC